MVRFSSCILFLLMIIGANHVWSQQLCTALGQNPGTAFPVCGTNVFTQTSVPACGGRILPTPCAGNAGYSDVNPYWYKFTCYASGTLGFVITPKNLGDDYDWQIFDITGRDPMDIYTDRSLIVSANWSGSPGVTGASPSAVNSFECASNPTQGISTFSTMPNLLVGHEYLLLVSHFDGATQSGYTLSFPTGAQGGTASIVNPVIPTVVNAYAVCDGSQVILKMNKKINCSSLASDGSDFQITGPTSVSILSAIGNSCSNGFDTDSITLTLNTILGAGTYSINANLGSDGNTLTDNCANSLSIGKVSGFKFISAQPTPLDSISPFNCITDSLVLEFSKPILCSSLAADGSDFIITGPINVSIKSATGNCSNGMTTQIKIKLNSAIKVNGIFNISVKTGTDGNTLIDECGFVTPVGSGTNFITQNITAANYLYQVNPGCKTDTLILSHNGNGNTTNWLWKIDSMPVSTLQNLTITSKAFGKHSLQLFVNNGFCTDSASSFFDLPDFTVKAAFASADTLCPSDTLHFTDLSSSSATAWKWDFGNGINSRLKIPTAQFYPTINARKNYLISLIAYNNLQCTDTTYKYITVLATCFKAVPSAFTPNGDGLNDYLYPLNAFNADNMVFRVYNRYGQAIFESKSWTKKWDGRVNSVMQPSGTYVWTFSYNDHQTGEPIFLKGTTVLIR